MRHVMKNVKPRWKLIHVIHDSCARITKSIDPEVFSSYYRNSHEISWAKYRESWLTKNRFEMGHYE